jgi:hypothetical protein
VGPARGGQTRTRVCGSRYTVDTPRRWAPLAAPDDAERRPWRSPPSLPLRGTLVAAAVAIAAVVRLWVVAVAADLAVAVDPACVCSTGAAQTRGGSDGLQAPAPRRRTRARTGVPAGTLTHRVTVDADGAKADRVRARVLHAWPAKRLVPARDLAPPVRARARVHALPTAAPDVEHQRPRLPATSRAPRPRHRLSLRARSPRPRGSRVRPEKHSLSCCPLRKSMRHAQHREHGAGAVHAVACAAEGWLHLSSANIALLRPCYSHPLVGSVLTKVDTN